MSGYDAYLANQMEAYYAGPTREEVQDSVDYWSNSIDLHLSAHLTYRAPDDYEIEVLWERSTDIAGQDKVAEFSDVNEFADWMQELDRDDMQGAEAELEERRAEQVALAAVRCLHPARSAEKASLSKAVA